MKNKIHSTQSYFIMGKKGSKRGSKGSRQSNQLLLRDAKENQEYAEVLKPLGCGQFMVKLLNGLEVIGKLKGSMSNRRTFDKVVPGNWVLVMLDGCTTGKDKYYIFHKYSDSEKKKLEKLGELVQMVEADAVESSFGFEGDQEVQEANDGEIDDDFINDI